MVIYVCTTIETIKCLHKDLNALIGPMGQTFDMSLILKTNNAIACFKNLIHFLFINEVHQCHQVTQPEFGLHPVSPFLAVYCSSLGNTAAYQPLSTGSGNCLFHLSHLHSF